MLEPSLLLKSPIIGTPGSDEAKWGALDMFPSNTSVAFPLDVQPANSGNGNVSFVTNAPAAPSGVLGLSKAAKFNASTSQLSFANQTPFDLNNYTDFCVETWGYATGPSIFASLWHPNVASRCVFSFTMDTGQIALSSTGAGWIYINPPNTGAYPYNVWGHYAVNRQGSVGKCWYNGNLIATMNSTLNPLLGDLPAYLGYRNDGATGMTAGSYQAGFRITRGNARYTKNFTPCTIFR